MPGCLETVMASPLVLSEGRARSRGRRDSRGPHKTAGLLPVGSWLIRLFKAEQRQDMIYILGRHTW